MSVDHDATTMHYVVSAGHFSRCYELWKSDCLQNDHIHGKETANSWETEHLSSWANPHETKVQNLFFF